MATTSFIYNQSDIETIQPASSCNQFAHEVEGIKLGFKFQASRFTAPRIYRRQLKMYRKVTQFIDRHPALTNLWIGGWAVGFSIYIFLYY